MKRALLIPLLLCSVAFSQGDYNIGADPDCVAWWRFEPGNLEKDSASTNDFAVIQGPPTVNTSNYKEGEGSADLHDEPEYDRMYLGDGPIAPTWTNDFPGNILGAPHYYVSLVGWFYLRDWPEFNSPEYVPTVGIWSFLSYHYRSYWLTLSPALSGSGPRTVHVRWHRGGAYYGGIHIRADTDGLDLELEKWYHIGFSIDCVNEEGYLQIWRPDTGAFWSKSTTTNLPSQIYVESGRVQYFILGGWNNYSDGLWNDCLVDSMAVFKDVLEPHEMDLISGRDTIGGQIISIFLD
ncbi:MAG: hypothetical protein ACXABF_15380 [Candidatus Thorarchaeota archaeon]|jgi:hypothetical protein